MPFKSLMMSVRWSLWTTQRVMSWTCIQTSSLVSESRMNSGMHFCIPQGLFLTILFSSFLLRRSAALYNRRHSKILTTLCSQFTSYYIFHWPKYFPDTPLQYPPSFDGRIVLYPTEKEVRDYFAWRQVDSKFAYLCYFHPLKMPLQPTSTTCITQRSGLWINRVAIIRQKLIKS